VQPLEVVPGTRLFFALWPEAEVAEAIYRASKALVPAHIGRRLPPTHLHLTLAFLGHITTEQLQCMLPVAEALHAEAFTVQLDAIGHFPRPQVVWLGVKTPPLALQHLQQQLVRDLAQHCGYQPESRAFVAHMTLWRKVKQMRLPQTITPIEWPVTRIVLASSHTLPDGAEYSIMQEWPLTPAQACRTC
jgi:RNA 2',3'-cyclic 3'-phosphodiesterase